MPNTYKNKVVLSDGTTLIDLTGDTATPADVEQGKTFHLASGEPAEGTRKMSNYVQDVQINGTSIVSQGVANISPASNSNGSLGVVKVDYSVGGIGANDAGRLYLYDANGLVKAGSERYKAISPRLQHEAAFYGLAKAAGDSTQASSNNSVGTYTDEAINAILAMLGVYNRIITPSSGNTFTLLPYPFSYSFGEMATLTVTVTATSQFHFMFSCPSGAATVLTMTGITGTDTKNSDTVEAGKTYEVDIWAGIALVKEIEVTAA